MTIEEALEHFKTPYELCKKINAHTANFTRWKKSGFIPVTQQLKINMVTGADMPIDLSKDELLKRVEIDSGK